jgi:hypothetical protein
MVVAVRAGNGSRRGRRATALVAAVLALACVRPAQAASDSPGAEVALPAALLEPPTLPTGPVCRADRERIGRAAERYVAEAAQRVDAVVARLDEARRDAKTPKARIDALVADRVAADARRKDGEAYREAVGRLPLADCPLGAVVAPDLPKPSLPLPAPTALAAAADPVLDLRLVPVETCRAETRCGIRLETTLRRSSTDPRRAVVRIEAAGARFGAANGPWTCVGLAGGALCSVDFASLEGGSSNPQTLSLTFPRTQGPARLCAASPAFDPGLPPSRDPERVRLVQALIAGDRPAELDGRFKEPMRASMIAALAGKGLDRAEADDDTLVRLYLATSLATGATGAQTCISVPVEQTIARVPPTAIPDGGKGEANRTEPVRADTARVDDGRTDPVRTVQKRRIIPVEEPPARRHDLQLPNVGKLLFGRRGAIPFGF